MMNRTALVLFVLTVIVTSAFCQERRNVERLWWFLQSPKFRSLSGTLQVTVFHTEGERSWSMDLWADEVNSRLQVTMPHPEGERKIITITRPDGVWFLLPFAKRCIRHESGTFPSWREFWGIRSDKLDLAKRNYILRVIGREKLVELFCLVLELTPQVKGPPIRKIWVHPPTRLPLRIERYLPEDNLELRLEFTKVRLNQPLPVAIFDATPPSDWKLEEVPLRRDALNIADAEKVLGFRLLLPTWLPPNYTLEGAFVLQTSRHKIAHLVYTDGIGVISVLEHPFGRDRPRPKSRSPMVRHMLPQRFVSREVGNLRIVIISDVIKEWLEKMADSIASATSVGR